jgi:hypothetical protein
MVSQWLMGRVEWSGPIIRYPKVRGKNLAIGPTRRQQNM